MATVRPFRGLRPRPEYALRVAARPYDVLNSDEARKEASGNPFSFLHIGKSEIDLPFGADPYSDQVYQKAKENLAKLVQDGVLIQDEKRVFYLYAQHMGNHVQTGIVGCVSVEEYKRGIIKKHELTRPDKELDRTKHILVTGAQTGPILMAYRSEQGITKTTDAVAQTTPTYDFHANDGIRHQLWLISDESQIRSLEDSFRKVPFLYIADGHHRSAATARATEECIRATKQHRGDEEYNFFLAVMFPHDQLQILEYNRLVKDLNGQSLEDFMKSARTRFVVEQSPEPVKPVKKSTFGMYVDGSWYLLKPKQLAEAGNPIERLDVSVLQRELLQPILGIDDQRTNKRIDFVGGIRGLTELERRVNRGEMAVAFSLCPTSIDELFAIADAGEIMPPKSTWFEPKLRDGVVVHLIE